MLAPHACHLRGRSATPHLRGWASSLTRGLTLGISGHGQCALVRSGSAYAPLRRWPIRCRIACRCHTCTGSRSRESSNIDGTGGWRPLYGTDRCSARWQTQCAAALSNSAGLSCWQEWGPRGSADECDCVGSPARRRHDCASEQSQKLDREVPRFCASSDQKSVRLIDYRCRAFTYKRDGRRNSVMADSVVPQPDTFRYTGILPHWILAGSGIGLAGVNPRRFGCPPGIRIS